MPPGSIERIIVAVFGGGAAGIGLKALFDYLTTRYTTHSAAEGDTQELLWSRVQALEEQVAGLQEKVDEWQKLYYETRTQNKLLRNEIAALREQNAQLKTQLKEEGRQ